jgi:hypothetical protein
MSVGPPKILQVMSFRTPAEAQARLAQLDARYRRQCEYTGAALYKTASGVVLRLASPTSLEVLSNCVC